MAFQNNIVIILFYRICKKRFLPNFPQCEFKFFLTFIHIITKKMKIDSYKMCKIKKIICKNCA